VEEKVPTYLYSFEDKEYPCWSGLDVNDFGLVRGTKYSVNVHIRERSYVPYIDYISKMSGEDNDDLRRLDGKRVAKRGGLYVFAPLLKYLCDEFGTGKPGMYAAITSGIEEPLLQPSAAPPFKVRPNIVLDAYNNNFRNERYLIADVAQLFLDETKGYTDAEKDLLRNDVYNSVGLPTGQGIVDLDSLRRCAIANAYIGAGDRKLPEPLMRTIRHNYGWGENMKRSKKYKWVTFTWKGFEFTPIYDGEYWRLPAYQLSRALGYEHLDGMGKQIRAAWAYLFHSSWVKVITGSVAGKLALDMYPDITKAVTSYTLLTIRGVEVACKCSKSRKVGATIAAFLREYTPMGYGNLLLPEEQCGVTQEWVDWLKEKYDIEPSAQGATRYWSKQEVISKLLPGATSYDLAELERQNCSIPGRYEDRGMRAVLGIAVKKGLKIPLSAVPDRVLMYVAPVGEQVENADTLPLETPTPVLITATASSDVPKVAEELMEEVAVLPTPVAPSTNFNVMPDFVPDDAVSAPLENAIPAARLLAQLSSTSAVDQQRENAKLILKVLDHCPHMDERDRNALLYYIMAYVVGIRVPSILGKNGRPGLTATQVADKLLEDDGLVVSPQTVGCIATALQLELLGHGTRVVCDAMDKCKPLGFKVIRRRWDMSAVDLIRAYLKSKK